MIYGGYTDGELFFLNLVLKGKAEYTKDEILLKMINAGFDFHIPEDYLHFMEFSNGLAYYKEGGMDIHPLKNMVDFTKANEFEQNKMLLVGSNNNSDDNICLDCSHSYGVVYINQSCTDEFKSTNMTFTSFMDTSLKCSGYAFWSS